MCYVLHVRPHAKENRIERVDAATLRVFVTASAEDGRANEAVIRLLAKHFRVAQSDVRIVRGKTVRTKTVEVAGLKTT